MPRVRTRQPDTARTAFTDHLLDTNEHRCNTASLQSPVEKTLVYPSVAKSYRIVEHTHHSVTSIPGSTGRTPPALSLQGGWSLSHCGFDATRAGL